jgi:hypothetical protein
MPRHQDNLAVADQLVGSLGVRCSVRARLHYGHSRLRVAVAPLTVAEAKQKKHTWKQRRCCSIARAVHPIVDELPDLGIVYKASAIDELAQQVISPGP